MVEAGRAGASSAAVAAALALALTLVACGDEPCDPLIDPSCDPSPYRYVAVVDRDTDATEGGIDIDAVALVRGGDAIYAAVSHSCVTGPNAGNASVGSDCDLALGPPQSALGECLADDATYAELGGYSEVSGDGGSLVISFAENPPIHQGDILRVFECGTLGMNADPYDIWVGTGTSADAPGWVVCAEGAVGVAECTVPALP